MQVVLAADRKQHAARFFDDLVSKLIASPGFNSLTAADGRTLTPKLLLEEKPPFGCGIVPTSADDQDRRQAVREGGGALMAKKPDRLGKRFRLSVNEGDPHWIQRRMIAFQSVANDASADLEEILEPLDAVVKHRGWDSWPEDEPYGSLDAMCLDQIGTDFGQFIAELKERVQTLETTGLKAVSGSGDSPVSTEDKALRERVKQFAVSEADSDWHRTKLGALYLGWDVWNRDFFEGLLTTPVIRLAEPSAPTILGQYNYVSSIGGAGEIRIRPSLLRGTHPMWDEPPTEDQALYFSQDVLLHEMIHQWQQEVTGNRESSYHGHGPGFRDKCNAIGAELDLPPVRTCKKRGKDAELPSCSHWPHCVRASGYAGSIR